MDIKNKEDLCDKPFILPTFPKNPMLAHAYVPWQNFNTIYSPQEGLEKGTIFPELTGLYEYYKYDYFSEMD